MLQLGETVVNSRGEEFTVMSFSGSTHVIVKNENGELKKVPILMLRKKGS